MNYFYYTCTKTILPFKERTKIARSILSEGTQFNIWLRDWLELVCSIYGADPSHQQMGPWSRSHISNECWHLSFLLPKSKEPAKSVDLVVPEGPDRLLENLTELYRSTVVVIRSQWWSWKPYWTCVTCMRHAPVGITNGFSFWSHSCIQQENW